MLIIFLSVEFIICPRARARVRAHVKRLKKITAKFRICVCFVGGARSVARTGRLLDRPELGVTQYVALRSLDIRSLRVGFIDLYRNYVTLRCALHISTPADFSRM